MTPKKTPTAPTPPDPAKVAASQFGYGAQTGIANALLGNANQNGPYGNVSYGQTGSTKIGGVDIPQFTQTTSLSAPEQAKYDLYNKQIMSLGNGISPVDTSGLPGVTNDFSADRSAVEKAMFDRLNPQLELQRNSLENKLVNQGLVRGTDAFTQAMNEQGRNENDARLDITARGLQEQQGLFGMSQANRSRAFNEMMAGRSAPINEFNALSSGSPVQAPQASYNAPSIASPDIAGATYNTAALQNQQYGQELQQQNSAMGGIFGLGQAAVLGAAKNGMPAWMSDRRLKRDVRDLGVRLLNGIKLYAYRYLWEAHERVGVMAQEVLGVRPDAVTMRGGYLAVHYGAL